MNINSKSKVMVIDENLLLLRGAKVVKFKSGEYIFTETGVPEYYYYIKSGHVKLNKLQEKNKEIIRAILPKGFPIAQSPLFTNRPYNYNAQALTTCSIIILEKELFFKILTDFPDAQLEVIDYLSRCLHFANIITNILFESDPIAKLNTLFNYLKSFQNNSEPFTYRVDLTRQQIANMIGLRVETTIRNIKTMEKSGIVRIQNGKVFY